MRPAHVRFGSNAWAAGSRRTSVHRALVANDPHVDLTIPGIWYLIDLQAPGLHAAGAVIPGLPGVTLGHNERIAWAATNAQAATTVLYRASNLPARARVLERFAVRLSRPVWKAYYRTSGEFSVRDDEDPGRFTFARWPPYRQNATTIATNIRLDRASSVADAMRILSNYRGSPENFIVADASGAIAYHLAGEIPDDPAWGRYVHPARDLSRPLRVIPFAQLPARAASRNAVLLSANNRMYGANYPYRLSAGFELPYRANRIAALLHARKRYDRRYFAAMQLDTYSPIDAEIARDVTRLTGALARWDGRFRPASKAASLEHDIRAYLEQQQLSLPAAMAQLRETRTSAGIFADLQSVRYPAQNAEAPWAQAGRVEVDHPLSPMWYGMLRGTALPGDGDEYTIHLQEPGFAQGFRAVWEVGNWDAGGIVIPSGESGRPGSPHYDDLARTWIRGSIVPLPFSHAALARQTEAVLTLRSGMKT